MDSGMTQPLPALGALWGGWWEAFCEAFLEVSVRRWGSTLHRRNSKSKILEEGKLWQNQARWWQS